MPQERVLLLTDIVDSTQLNEQIGDAATAALWEQHDRGARALMRRHGGREIGRADGFLVLFERVADAAAFAAAYHHLLRAECGPLGARVGIHAGPLSLRANAAEDVEAGAVPMDVDGLALPIAARVMAAAGRGQTLLSDAAFAALGAAAGRHADHGHWRMKGVATPVRLYEIGDEKAPMAPPADSEKAYRVVRAGDLWLPRREVQHTLPAERDSFVGREAELDVLARWLREDRRLVSVVGIGGVGKTRLATRYAWTWLGEHAGGSFFCDLAPARDADAVLRATAAGLGIALTGDTAARQIGHAITGRGSCLVILDNTEQVQACVVELMDGWLAAAPRARFIVTTRQVLGLPGEQVLDVGPLPDSDSAALFASRAEAAGAPAVDVDDAVAGLVRLLDGLPLAIELAAARARLMSPRALLQRMGDRFRLLAAAGGRPERQSTLRRAFDWSWDLLEPAEQAALAQCSVFEGGFTIEAAEAVLLVDDGGSPWTLDLLQALVDRSLVRRVGDGRFALLPSVRQYAAERLAAPGRWGAGEPALAAARARHWRYYGTLDDVEALGARRPSIDDLVAACRRATEAGDFVPAAGALVGVWALLRLVGPFATAIELAEMLLRRGVAGSSHAKVRWVAGAAEQQLGRFNAARRHCEIGLTVEGIDSDDGARLEAALGEALAAVGGCDEASACFERALVRAREAGDTALEGRILNSRGALASDRGRLDDAAADYALALAAARGAADRRLEGGVVGNLAWLAYARGDRSGALAGYAQALALAVDAGDRRWEGNARCNLGLLLQEGGDVAGAREQLEAALAIARATGHARLEATVLCNLGLLLEAEGDGWQACDLHRQAVAAALAMGDRRSEGRFRSDLGRLLMRLGRAEEARDCFVSAEAALADASDAIGLGVVLCRHAQLCAAGGEAGGALALFERAEALAREAGAKPGSELGAALDEVRGALGRD